MNFNNNLNILIKNDPLDSNTVPSLPQLWAKKYVGKLVDPEAVWKQQASLGRKALAAKLQEHLRNTSAKAWTKTEMVLGQEVQRHDIDHQLINPWQISRDVYQIYEQALDAYSKNIIPRRLSVLVGAELGEIRQKYTAVDPRIVGFVSMQFHYTGELLLDPLPAAEKETVGAYFKVIDDHLYMPLQRAYNAAAEYEFNSPILAVVRKLLPLTTEIAEKICQEVIELYPSYRCYTDSLSHSRVQISSRRDVEMFQVYLCVCALEQNISIVKQELFPLCVMLYPALNVSWELVQQLIGLLQIEIQRHLGPQQMQLFKPYLRSMEEMFSPEVFPEEILEKIAAG